MGPVVVASGAVSIHAPAEGATMGFHHCGSVLGSFNPRARGGRDLLGSLVWRKQQRFQSTRPRRARRRILPRRVRPNQFQSTRPRRARLAELGCSLLGYVFQSTRPRRARHSASCWGVIPGGFQSTRPRRARPRSAPIDEILVLFQSTRPRRARPHRRNTPRWWPSFNPRARGGRDSHT